MRKSEHPSLKQHHVAPLTMYVLQSSLTIEDESIPCEKHRYYMMYHIQKHSVHIQHTMNYTKHKEDQPPETYQDIEITDAEEMTLEDLLGFLEDMIDIQDWMYSGVGDLPKDQLLQTPVCELHTLGNLSIYVI